MSSGTLTRHQEHGKSPENAASVQDAFKEASPAVACPAHDLGAYALGFKGNACTVLGTPTTRILTVPIEVWEPNQEQTSYIKAVNEIGSELHPRPAFLVE